MGSRAAAPTVSPPNRRAPRSGAGVLALTTLASVFLLPSCTTSSPPATRDISAESPFNLSEGWLGGDCAATIPLNNSTLWLFGDSGIGTLNDKGAYAEGSTLVNNTIGIQPLLVDSTTHGSTDIRFFWREARDPADGKTKPAALFTPPRESEWYWPTGGGTSFNTNGNTTLILFMARIFRPRPTDDGTWNFDGRGSDLLLIENPGPDPREWRPRIIETPGALKAGEAPTPGARRISWGTATVLRGEAGDLFIFGVDTTDPFNKKAILARVPATDAADTNRWQFWSTDHWSPRVEDCTSVADNVMDEFSVSAINAADGTTRYILVYSEPMLGKRIFARKASTITGPWSAPITLYTCPEPDQDNRLFAYSAKAHAELSKPGELVITYCVNSSDFWYMLSNAAIYRPRVIRVRVPE